MGLHQEKNNERGGNVNPFNEVAENQARSSRVGAIAAALLRCAASGGYGSPRLTAECARECPW